MKHALSSENIAVDDPPELTKIVCTQEPGAHFCAEYKVETLYSDTGTVPEF